MGAIKGMSTACKRFETPVTGGNVSFYNQTNIKDKIEPVYPTPTIGMLGIMEDKKLLTSLSFKNEGDFIYLIGNSRNDIACSEYLYGYHKVMLSPPPYFDLEEEYDMQQAVSALIREGLIASAHDVSEGGLFITLFESGRPGKLGFDITSDYNLRKDAFLFGEAQSRVVVSIKPELQEDFVAFLAQTDVAFSLLGKVTSGEMLVDGVSFGQVTEAIEVYDNALGKMMG
ncbi:MAG: Phosphoribosylformylglycinamidine synthase 2 [Bacteroidetes bacterium ADurb.Bin408]|nr:MAG: Phosphoribosylformylglycinamidine synthase 2 [Bacteroidetes bacterium ADurb.Bin408]